VSLRDHFTEQTYLAYLAIPRMVVGYFFLEFGWEKANARFLTGQQFARQLSRASADPLPFHRNFILHFVAPHSHFFSYLVAFGEIAIGLSLIFGLLVRLSSAFGIFHNLNIMFAIALPNGGPQVGLNRIFIVLELMFIVAAAGRVLGLDGILAKRFPRNWLF
jgi:thiosulfate dehydrogenase [quinone] large subunit